MNVVLTGGGRFVEVQGTGEEATFSETELSAMLQFAHGGVAQIREIQQKVLGDAWPFNGTNLADQDECRTNRPTANQLNI